MVAVAVVRVSSMSVVDAPFNRKSLSGIVSVAPELPEYAVVDSIVRRPVALKWAASCILNCALLVKYRLEDDCGETYKHPTSQNGVC